MSHPLPATSRSWLLIPAGVGLFGLLTWGLAFHGVTYDEILYKFPGAWQQVAWLTQPGPGLLSNKQLHDAFECGSQHPSLHRTVMALSWMVFHRGLGLDELVAFRLPQAFYFVLAAVLACWFMMRRVGTTAGICTGAALVTMPHVWGLAHIACLDTVIAAAWLAVVLTYAWAAKRKGWRPALLMGVVYGLAVCVKLHALFIPLPLVAWALLHRPRNPWRPLLVALVAAPLCYVALQPWTWRSAGPPVDTIAGAPAPQANHLVGWSAGKWPPPFRAVGLQFQRYLYKDTFAPIRVYYFGQNYPHRPPWHYTPLMFALSIPAPTLLLLLMGLALGLARPTKHPLALLLGLNLITALGIFLLPRAGVYDGVRLFLPAHYLGACLAGLGAVWLLQRLGRFEMRPALRRAAPWVLPVVIALPGVLAIVRLHPAELSYHNLFIGGTSGAHAAGMQTTYWGETITRPVLDEVNRAAGPNARLAVLALPTEAFYYYQHRGWLRDDIQLGTGPPYDLHLLHARQSFFNQVAWFLYGNRRHNPALYAMHREGVPVVLLFGPLPPGPGTDH